MSVTESVNILMVDDQPGKLLSYQAILEDLGENLLSATSGKQALELLLSRDVAIILMDVSMPELDGFELADLIRQHPRFQKTAIIFISAVHLTDLDRMKGYQRGAMDYISVPVVPELLRAKVSVFADGRHGSWSSSIASWKSGCWRAPNNYGKAKSKCAGSTINCSSESRNSKPS
jgi:CheY-like chemotaxis protein